MQDLNAPPRDAFTAAQITALLVKSANPHYGRGLEVLDPSLKVVADVSDYFEGGQITRTMYATVHGTCSLNVAEGFTFNPGVQLLRPYMTVTGDDGTGQIITARFNCGVYRVARPQTDYTTTPGTNPLTGSDRLSLLDRPVGNAYTVAKGTQYLAAVRQAISNAGLDPTTVRLDMTKASAILPVAKPWPLLVDTTTTDKAPTDATASSSNATTWLDVINDLLAAINYRGLWADQDGVFTSGPYARPADRSTEFVFDFDAADVVIAPSRTLNVDQTAPVNVWIFQQSNLADAAGNPVEPTEGNGQYTRRNQNYGPTSIDEQGGIEWVDVVQLDAADQATLVAQGDAQADQVISSKLTYSVTTAPFPVAGHFDIYSYSDTRVLGGASNVMSTEWTLDLGSDSAVPADQTWTWQAT